MTYRTINPATGETARTFGDISDADLDNALDTARSCYQDDWRHRAVADRARIVKAAAAELRANAAEYAQYVTAEMGKLIGTSEAEVGLSAAILDYYADRAESFLAPEELPESPGAVIETEPIGVILGIEPWNFPYYQLARVAGPQLMAGNVLIIKHAENVPHCALAFARLFEKAAAPAGVYTNVFASIDQIGRLIEDPRIAGVTVTGSERAGSAVAERADRSLKKAVMELGGSMQELGVKPELEIYDTGHLDACLRLRDAGLLSDEPLQFSIVLGVKGGMAASADNLITMVRRLPAGCVWQVIAIGRANLELTAVGLALGGNARAGLEDTLYLRKGEQSPGNLPLVQRAVALAAALDRPAASVDETAALLRLPPR